MTDLLGVASVLLLLAGVTA